jgi:hypothetical protein
MSVGNEFYFGGFSLIPLLGFNFGNATYTYNGTTYASASALFAALGSYTGGVVGATVTRGDGTIASFAAANTPRVAAPSSVTNLILNSATFGTQTITVVSGVTYTLSAFGTAAGVLTCSGASTATLTGTGASNRVSTSFAATTTSLTVTLTSGTWTNSQLDIAPVARAYVSTTGAAATADDYTAVRGNVCLQSNALATAPWNAPLLTVTNNAALAPDGTMTAASLVPTAVNNVHNISQSNSITGPGCYSFYVQANGYNAVSLSNVTQTIGADFINLNTTPTANPFGTGTMASITSVGNGWYRAVINCTFGLVGNLYLFVNGRGTYVGNGSSINVWNVQWEPVLYNNTTLTYPTPYIPTTGAAVYVYDTTISGAGLLVEQASTNLLLQSNAFTTTWTNTSGPTPVAAAQVSPDQTVDAWSWTRTATTAQYNYQGVTSGASLAYTGSIIAKAGTGRYLALRLGSAAAPSASNNVQAVFDLFAGTVSTAASNISWTLPSATITPLTNGFYRCTLTGTCDATANPSFYYSFSSVSQQVDGATGAIGDSGYIYGAQLEQSAFPTSYIATGASTVTRAQDVPLINGNLLGSGNWAWLMDVVNVTSGQTGGNPALGSHQVTSATTNEVFMFAPTGGTGISAQETVAGVGTPTSIGSAPLTTKSARIAAAMNGTALTASANGAAPTSFGTWTPITPIQMRLGENGNAANPLNGYIRRAQVWQGGNYSAAWLQGISA